jgi:hypothetical protein
MRSLWRPPQTSAYHAPEVEGALMHKHLYTAIAATLLLSPFAPAGGKSKDKPMLPLSFLHARTVSVIIDPTAGISLDDPRANQIAQRDVETALLHWGRFQPSIGAEQVDLIIVIRKGSGKLVNPTISDTRQNNRAGVINPSDDGISIGAQHGQQPPLSNNPFPGTRTESPRPQTEIGNIEDSFLVYDATGQNPLDAPPGWRYIAKDALKPHTVPAVAEFKKAIDEAEKAAAKQSQPKNPPASSPNHP